MNKKFLSAILFGALMVTSTGTFVSCKDYDDDIEELSNEKDALAKQIAELEAQMSSADAATKAQLEQLKKDLAAANAEQLAKIQAALDELKKNMTSLVFVPQSYYGGIEAMVVNTYNYQSWTVEAVSADADNSKDAPVAGSQVEMAPKLFAQYHVNPSTVTTEDVLAVKFLAADKEYESRAYADVIETEVFDYNVTGGLLNVSAQIKDGSIKMDKDGDVTVLAAQATINNDGEEVTVTSDYAVARSAKTKGFDLAMATDEADPIVHLYGNAAEAIANAPLLEVVWNQTFDLADTIRTHIDDCAKNLDVNANDGVAAAQGFEYTFELAGYTSGGNKTSQSAHAALDGSVFRPQMSKDGKQQAYGAEQNKATIGRMPLVRVILTDKISGNIAAVGYMKVAIVAEPAPVKKWTAVSWNYTFNDEFTVDCAKNEFKFELPWHVVEEGIIAKLNISKDVFEKTYKIETVETDADQFTAATVEATKVAEKIGVVAKTTTDTGSDQTEVISWTVAANKAYQLFKVAEDGSITVNVRFVNTDAMKYAYLSFTWKPEPLNITPSGAIEDANKIKEYWYAKNGAIAGEGYSDIHANVKQVNSSNDCTFNSDILNTLVGNVITVANDDETYPAFADKFLKKSVVFAPVQDHLAVCEEEGHEDCYVVNGASGEVYEITVAKDGKTLYANILGEIATEAVVVLEGTVMKYQENEYAKDILNYADHAKLADGETFTAKLMFEAGLCDYVEYALSNNVFYAKYLRPVSAKPAEVEELVDAANGVSKAALNLQLEDWRDKKFDVVEDTEGFDFYAYYGVSKIAADLDNATTNLNGGTLGETLLNKVTTKVELGFNAPTTVAKGAHGEFTYKNNGNTLGEFTVQVPLVITYKWGKIYTSVDLVINKTINN